jgi:Protein of unknown function (DUF4231)
MQNQSKSLPVSLVDKQQMATFIDKLEGLSDDQRQSLKQRWLHQVLWWDQRSSEARRGYFRLRWLIIAGGVVIPVLTGLSLSGTPEYTVRVAAAVISAVVAGCAAWEGVANYGEVWREKRRAAELLKVEGWQFFQLAGEQYLGKNHAQAYPYFAAKIESLIAKEIGEYVSLFDPTSPKSPTTGTTANSDLPPKNSFNPPPR